MRAIRLSVAALAIALVGLGAIPAGAATTVTVTVTDEDGGAPVAGAFVALMGETGRTGGVTADDGTLSLLAEPGTFAMTVSAPGRRVHTQAPVTIADVDPQLAVALEDSGNIFEGLGANGAQTSAILSDGLPGVFYLTTTAIPSLYRTADHGGHWAPVTISTDDPVLGIDGSGVASGATTSGFEGEVAAIVGNAVWFSRDFGNTWRSIPAPPMGHGGGLLWGHVGDLSVLLAVNGTTTEMYFADMPTGAETALPSSFTQLTSSYKQAAGDEVAIANGSDAPVVAVAPASGGDVLLYEVDATPSRTDASTTATGSAPGAMPTFVRLGGPPASGAPLGGGTAPNTVLTYSNVARSGEGHAVMASYADPEGDGAPAWYATDSTPVFHNQDNDSVNATLDRWSQDPAACGGMEGSIGSISPLGQTGTVSMCWVTQEGATLADLHVRQVRFINNNTGIAFDAGYDGVDNHVLISGDGEKGATKSASEATEMDGDPMHRPRFLEWPAQASAGTGADSGGVSIEGIGSAVIRDTDFGPAGAQQIVTALSFTGGGRVLATANGGDDWAWIAGDGASAAEWWATSGANTSWILAGAGGQANLLVGADVPADADTTGDDPAADVPSNVLPLAGGPGGSALPGTDAVNFGLNGANSPAATAIVGVEGTDVAFVGTATNQNDAGSVRKVTVSGTRAAPDDRSASVTAPGDLGDVTNPVTALAYCPTEGSAASTADTLYVALGNAGATPGGVAAVRTAMGASPTVEMATEPDGTTVLEGDINDVRVDCAGGQVYAARSPASGPPMDGAQPVAGLLVSNDGGETFAPLVIDLPPPPAGEQTPPPVTDVETIDVEPGEAGNPTDPDTIVVVGGDGTVVVGGVDPSGEGEFVPVNQAGDEEDRSFGAERPGDVDIPPPPDAPPARTRASGVGSAAAVLGSGAGLFSMAAPDLTAPVAPVLGALPAYATSNRVQLTWTAGSDAESGIASYGVTYRRLRFQDASYASSAAPWRTVSGTATSVLLPAVTPGARYCFRLTAVNGSGLSTTSNERCTVVPLDDPSLSKSSGAWRTYGPSSTYAGYYMTSYTQTATSLQSLRFGAGVRGARKLVIVATRCPTCGTIDVYIGTLHVKRLSLYASTTQKMRYLSAYASATARTGAVVVKVVSPRGKLVRIEGLLADR